MLGILNIMLKFKTYWPKEWVLDYDEHVRRGAFVAVPASESGESTEASLCRSSKLSRTRLCFF